MQVVSGTPTPSVTTSAQTLLEAQSEPGGIAIGEIPTVGGVTTLQSVTAQIIRTDTNAVLGTSVVANGAASTQQIGGIVVCAPIPAGVAGALALQVLGSAAAGAVGGTVTLTVLP